MGGQKEEGKDAGMEGPASEITPKEDHAEARAGMKQESLLLRRAVGARMEDHLPAPVFPVVP